MAASHAPFAAPLSNFSIRPAHAQHDIRTLHHLGQRAHFGPGLGKGGIGDRRAFASPGFDRELCPQGNEFPDRFRGRRNAALAQRLALSKLRSALASPPGFFG